MAGQAREIQKPKRSGNLKDSDVIAAIERVVSRRTRNSRRSEVGRASKRTVHKKAARKKAH